MKIWKCPSFFVLSKQNMSDYICVHARTCTNVFLGR